VSDAGLPVGERVRVRATFPPGHVRTPAYIRGKTGIVERVLAVFPDPEERAFGRPGLPGRRLYRVRFPQREVWPEYAGSSADTVDIEIYEQWLQTE
jgi:nitrile hydratase subunit beta